MGVGRGPAGGFGAGDLGRALSPPLPCRKRPGRTVYAQMYNEKEQEMTSPAGHSQGVQGALQGEEFVDDELDSQTLGNARPETRPPPPTGPAQDAGPGRLCGVSPPSGKVMGRQPGRP